MDSTTTQPLAEAQETAQEIGLLLDSNPKKAKMLFNFTQGVFGLLAHKIRQVNDKNGWSEWDTKDAKTQLAHFSLMHTEISEMVEELRKPEPDVDAVLEEGADVFIRLLDFFSLNLIGDAELAGEAFAEAIIKKLEKNAARAYRHGNKRA